ncbi:MAG TPA: class I SAM-dependent methyltransferase [Solirubrobacterales bacterium]|nr:class I SAM-dependent methyltransferase [Solirubrobacterales bacterium]
MGKIYDATWGRGFSALYDRCFKASEEAGLRDMRRDLVAQARGRVLELGAGTGLNLDLYPQSVQDLTLTEPDPHMTKQLRKKVEESGRRAEVVEASAEGLPFDDDSFDTAVVTLVLCTVPDPDAALREIARVLKPDGRFLFLEHVRSIDPAMAKWQDRLEAPWRFLGDGCHCNRDTVSTISAAGFQLGAVERPEFPKGVPIIKPMAKGSAVQLG